MREIIAHLLGLDRELIALRAELHAEQTRRLEAEYEARRLRTENAWALKELKEERPMKQKQKLYRITVSEKLLLDIAHAVEDYHRFLRGNMSMYNACSYLKGNLTSALVYKMQAATHPELAPNAYFSWCGGGCNDEALKAAIIRTYPLYRNILHHFAVKNGVDKVHASETLTCEGQEPMKIEEVEE